jgi:hypothetical protein
MSAVRWIIPALLIAAGLGSITGETVRPEISVASLVRSVTVDGDRVAVSIERGAPPPATAAPVIDATLPTATINGGSFAITVTGSEPFAEIALGMGDVHEYLRVALPSPKTSARIVVTLDPGAPDGPVQMFVAAGTSPTAYGPHVTRALSVRRVGTGDVQVSVAWNTAADLDLHVVDPNGDELYWDDRKAASGGELDLDSNAACDSDQSRNENAAWPVGRAPGGKYVVYLDHWDSCGAQQTDYVVTVWVGQDAQTFSGTFTGIGEHGGAGDGIEITEFTR